MHDPWRLAMSTISRRGAVVVDVDGTLVSTGGKVPPDAVEAISALASARALVILATGRPYPMALRVAQELAVRPDVVASNGNYVKPVGAPGRIAKPFTWQLVDAALVAASKNAAHALCFSSDGRNYAVTSDEAFRDVLRQYGEPTAVQVTRTELRRRSPTFTHIHLIRPSGWQQKIIVDGATTATSEPAYMTLTPEGVTKATGVASVLSSYPVESWVAIFVVGDGENDLPLFELPDAVGIALGSGSLKLREKARVVAPGLDEGGFAWAVHNIILPALG